MNKSHKLNCHLTIQQKLDLSVMTYWTYLHIHQFFGLCRTISSRIKKDVAAIYGVAQYDASKVRVVDVFKFLGLDLVQEIHKLKDAILGDYPKEQPQVNLQEDLVK